MTHPTNDADRDRLQALIGEDYRLQWIIGHGGMSTVWLADDTVHDREVAIKALRPEFSNAPEFLSRFRNEAEAARGIDSDNVVRTFDYREIPDPAGTVFCFIVMEYVRGESLADLLAREGALSEDLALDVLEQAAHGLSVIHRMGLVHRDIKPGNLLVTQSGQVKVTDFGIAKAAAAVPLTRTGMVVGTAQYVSPEQAQGHDITPASDVYSLGVVGYEMLSGQRPFTGDSSVSVVLAHINNQPPALTTAISAQTRELIGIALRKDPSRRFADGDEMALAISQVRLGNRPPQPRTAALAGYSEEPSPTASTAMLGQVAHPTTIHPAAAPAGGSQGRRQATAVPAKAKQKSGSGGQVAAGVGLGVLVAAAIAAGVWAATSGIFGGGDDDSTPETTAPQVVTEWVTPPPQVTTLREAPRQTVAPTPRTTPTQTQQQRPTEQSAPPTPTQQQTVPQTPATPTRTAEPTPTSPGNGDSPGGTGNTGNSTQDPGPTTNNALENLQEDLAELGGEL